MDNKLIEPLEKEIVNVFGNVYEYGGGYGYRYQHSIQVMNYCKKIIQFSSFKDKEINTDALFHDIGKIVAVGKDGLLVYVNYGDKSYEIVGSEIAPKYL